MGINELKYKGNIYTQKDDIIRILRSEKMNWLIDSEVHNAVIEIENSTLIWNSGTYISGNWYYGIFKGGEFFGKMINGIFENGHFAGEFISGIK